MRMFLWLVVLGACGSAPSPKSPSASSHDASAGHSRTVPPSEPKGDLVEPDNISDGPVIAYAIDGNSVDEATFSALFDRLLVEEQAYEGESVEEPDGSYGGAGQLFHALDGDVPYRYEFHTYPRDDEREGQSRMLFRE